MQIVSDDWVLLGRLVGFSFTIQLPHTLVAVHVLCRKLLLLAANAIASGARVRSLHVGSETGGVSLLWRSACEFPLQWPQCGQRSRRVFFWPEAL